MINDPESKWFVHSIFYKHVFLVQGTKQTVKDMWRLDGIRAFYKGFATVWIGTIPSRVVYISALEMMKSGLTPIMQRSQVSDVGSAGIINLVAGGTASLCSQSVFVPIDVVLEPFQIVTR